MMISVCVSAEIDVSEVIDQIDDSLLEEELKRRDSKRQDVWTDTELLSHIYEEFRTRGGARLNASANISTESWGAFCESRSGQGRAMQVRQIHCDRCHKVVTQNNVVEWQEMVSYSAVGGYGSVFGDGAEWGFDLCQKCASEVLGPYIFVTAGAGKSDG